MQVNVRLSSDLSRALGQPRVSATVAESATVADLIAALIASHPQDEAAISRAVVMVGGRHLGPNQHLESNRDVALLTPIAGGC